MREDEDSSADLHAANAHYCILYDCEMHRHRLTVSEKASNSYCLDTSAHEGGVIGGTGHDFVRP